MEEMMCGELDAQAKKEKQNRLLLFLAVLTAILLCAAFSVIGGCLDSITPVDMDFFGDSPTRSTAQSGTQQDTVAGSVEGSVPQTLVTLPKFTQDVWLCMDILKPAYAGGMDWSVVKSPLHPYSAVEFIYWLKNTNGILTLSTSADLSECVDYVLEEGTSCLYLHNLLVDTTYYYHVQLSHGEQYDGTFHTAHSNRFVYIPGILNTRDIGGYVNLDGQTVRQGLLIRGVEMDGLVVDSYYVPDEALEMVENTFGFVYDMDLRNPSVSPEGYTPRLQVAHSFYNAPQYGQIFEVEYRQSLKRIFTDLADPDKYPMYLHCTWGTDRTGTVVYLLQGVLNLSKEDMEHEYMLSSFLGGNALDLQKLREIDNGLQFFPGATLQEKVLSYLTMVVGVTDEQIQSIRDIFLQ